MLRILESQAPTKQTATDTISTLSSRLQSATLLEDRRAAILGLRSFAKLYPASVASGALRDLIAGLKRDGEDADTIKVVLETLLMLFEPDAKSLEASEEITLWLADEFTQRQDNITALLDLLEASEFYLRLYSMQILSHVSTARPERTQDAIFTAPLGVSRLVAVLDDKREPVRNEALLLLVALTPVSSELQKVVAFENAFDRIFALIEADGSLTHGSSMVQGCLSLLANLLRLNVSNQSYFREIGCIAKLNRLLANVAKAQDSEEGVSDWLKPQRDMNLWGTLGIVQLFLVRGGQGTKLNQKAFWQTGTLLNVLQLAFSPQFSISIRAKALVACADLIRGNAAIQEQFGDIIVPKPQSEAKALSRANSQTPDAQAPKLVNGHGAVPMQSNVIEVLLQLILEPAAISRFDLRLAAFTCLKAFFEDHAGIRAHVLRRAVEGYTIGADAVPNILEILLQPPGSSGASDPYQVWMAASILLHLIFDNTEAKSIALAVSEGDAEQGEEVVTLVQSIAGNIISGVQRTEDERALIGYLMLLCTWLFEDPDAVNDLLSEGSNIHSLAQAIKTCSHSMPLVAGLATLLLGIIYEFSSKDSPIPRKTLQGVLLSSLGREMYVDKLTQLRENVFVRDFEVLPQNSKSAIGGGLPEVFFDRTFIDFLKDNYSRFLRAIDRDPTFEVSVLANGVQKGISREMVDTLRAQLDERTKSLQSVESELVTLSRKLEQEELDHRRTRDSTAVEVNRIRQINQSLHDNHEEELDDLRTKHHRLHSDLVRQHQADLDELVGKNRALHIEQEQAAARTRERNEAEILDLKRTNAELEAKISKTERDHIQDLQTAHEEYMTKSASLEARLERAEERAQEAETRANKVSKELAELQNVLASAQNEANSKELARKAVQTEFDDLLVVFSDLEAKRAADKARLKDLGEDVSEDEEGDVDDGPESDTEQDEADVVISASSTDGVE